MWASLVLHMFAIRASATEIGVCMASFYLVAANNGQLGGGKEDARGALCTRTLFAHPPGPGDFLLSVRINFPRKESSWFSQVPSHNYHCVQFFKNFQLRFTFSIILYSLQMLCCVSCSISGPDYFKPSSLNVEVFSPGSCSTGLFPYPSSKTHRWL